MLSPPCDRHSRPERAIAYRQHPENDRKDPGPKPESDPHGDEARDEPSARQARSDEATAAPEALMKGQAPPRVEARACASTSGPSTVVVWRHDVRKSP
jgi:hypothetical protein